MKPVTQTKFGRGNGNCLSACVASILERPIESVPDFAAYEPEWFAALERWLAPEGMGLVMVEPKNLAILSGCWAIGIHSVTGRDETHAVVHRIEVDRRSQEEWSWRSAWMHDPNPHRVKIGELKNLIVIVPPVVPEDPSRFIGTRCPRCELTLLRFDRSEKQPAATCPVCGAEYNLVCPDPVTTELTGWATDLRECEVES